MSVNCAILVQWNLTHFTIIFLPPQYGALVRIRFLCFRLAVMSLNWVVITMCFYGLSLNSANNEVLIFPFAKNYAGIKLDNIFRKKRNVLRKTCTKSRLFRPKHLKETYNKTLLTRVKRESQMNTFRAAVREKSHMSKRKRIVRKESEKISRLHSFGLSWKHSAWKLESRRFECEVKNQLVFWPSLVINLRYTWRVF